MEHARLGVGTSYALLCDACARLHVWGDPLGLQLHLGGGLVFVDRTIASPVADLVAFVTLAACSATLKPVFVCNVFRAEPHEFLEVEASSSVALVLVAKFVLGDGGLVA